MDFKDRILQVDLESIDDIYAHSDKLIATVKNYDLDNG